MLLRNIKAGEAARAARIDSSNRGRIARLLPLVHFAFCSRLSFLVLERTSYSGHSSPPVVRRPNGIITAITFALAVLVRLATPRYFVVAIAFVPFFAIANLLTHRLGQLHRLGPLKTIDTLLSFMMMNNKHHFQLDYSYFRTDVSKRRRPAATRELTKLVYTASKRMISLAEGMPNDETFPFTEISVKLYDGSTFTLAEDELGQALQYLPSQGYPPLLQALRDFQRRTHAPPLWASRDIAIVSGSQDGLSKTLEAIVAPGDPLLVHEPFFPGVQIVVAPHKAELIAIPQDELGTEPAALRDVLQRRLLSGKKMPKIMYVNATGTNPTGVIIPYERRQEIYRIACEYNFLILDDDPYHFLHYTEEEPRSFLSLDTEGRVIRLDSFSKLVSAGLRIGFVTAPAPIIASIELHLQSSHLHASSLSQLILYKLMKIWGHEGIIEHFKRVGGFYKKRRDVIVGLAKKHLNGLADFTVPSSGFFLWIKVRGVKDTWKLVTQRATAHGVVFAPGAAFMKDPSKPCNAIRASFSKCSYEDMNVAMESLAQLIREELAANQTIIDGNEFRNGKANSSQALPLSG